MSRSLLAVALAAVLAIPATELSAQQQAVGEWEMTVQGRGGNSFTQTFAFTMEDGMLKGTVTGQGGTTELTNVWFQADTLKFDVTRTFGENSFTQTYTATISGDEMNGTISGGRGGRGGRGGPREFAAKKKAG